MSRSSESHGTYQTVEEYNAEVRRRAAVADPRDATISQLQAEIARLRSGIDRALEIHHADDADRPQDEMVCALVAALGGSNDKG